LNTKFWKKSLALALAGAVLLAPAAWMPARADTAAPAPPKLMTFTELRARPLPKASARIPYGALPDQFVDLWLPAGSGPFPVVVMVHGGCWRSKIASLEIMNFAAEDLRQRGIAVWNIEYRGVDRDGGGYPGTFQDVAAGADALRGAARQYHLRLDRVVSVGHSAGGHLVLWLAARHRLAKTSPLHAASPLPLAAAISLGGLPDLRAAHDEFKAGCGAEVVDALTGAPSAAHPDIYADTSPSALAPFGGRQILVSAALDPIAPPAVAAAYVAEVNQRGDRATATIIPDSGHAELIAPGSAAWTDEVAIIEQALGMTQR
jgi:acetyl esterase/lipase